MSSGAKARGVSEDMLDVCSGGPWKSNSATVIPVPGSERPSRARGTNPFSTNRMHNTLTGSRSTQSSSSAGHNVTASRTPFNLPRSAASSGSAAKRPRISNERPTVTSVYFTQTGDSRTSTSAGGPSSGRHIEPIEIPDDEEDIGEPVTGFASAHHRRRKSSSPDPIDSFSAASSSHPAQRHHPFSRPSSPEPPRRPQVEDGENTVRLRERVRSHEPPVTVVEDSDPLETDPITAFSDDDAMQRAKTPNGKTHIPANNVRQKVKAFETHNAPPIPHFDLRDRFSSVKNRMKGKDRGDAPLVTQPIGPQWDPVATSGSGFTPSSALKRGRKSTGLETQKINLPIDAWFLGYKPFQAEDANDVEPPFWLRYEPSSERPHLSALLHVVRKPGAKANVHEFRLERDVEEILYTQKANSRDPAEKVFVLRMKTRAPETKPRKSFLEYTPGSARPDGFVTFKFRTAHANWQGGEPYNKLVDALQKEVDTTEQVDGSGARALWEGACRSADHKKAELERTGLSSQPGSSRNAAEISILDDPDTRPTSLEDTESTTAPASRDRPVPGPAPRTGTAYAERTMRVTRQSLAAAERAERAQMRTSPSPDADELILIWPPQGAGAVNITRGDLKRLQPDQYLNDTLIEFGLKLWLNDLRNTNPVLAEQIHVFSSFFYKKLNVKNKEEGYQSVRKWTSKFDLFKKKYLVVPINEHFHWYLAIIYNPEHVLTPSPVDIPTSTAKPLTRKRKRESEVIDVEATGASSALSPPLSEDIVPDSCPPSPTHSHAPCPDSGGEQEVEELLKSTSCCSLTDIDSAPAASEAAHEQEEDVVMADASMVLDDLQLMYPDDARSSSPLRMDIDDTVEATSTTPSDSTMALSPLPRQDISMEVPAAQFYTLTPMKGKERAISPAGPVPASTREVELQQSRTYIFIFDSLGNRHPQAVKNLSAYLQMEAQDKKGVEDTSPAEGKHALVPSQLNYSDCGVYLIHYVATFMSDPTRFSQIILSKKARDYPASERSQDWQGEIVSDIRANLARRIEELSETWKKERATKEEQTKKNNEGSGSVKPAPAAPGSDDEIVIEDVEISTSTPTKAKTARGRQKDTQKGAAQVGAANRLR
ncbi:cysteine proteinase [Obba rivulosa]|uniref:Cysteine proteinase n=1 Tax=Obba rivulosa TaxID=1052685 RepID=A0A8E2B139_9APHY|nr:cysteine proteinase [Obba rivulosa]